MPQPHDNIIMGYIITNGDADDPVLSLFDKALYTQLHLVSCADNLA
jgi:hypothetical protein